MSHSRSASTKHASRSLTAPEMSDQKHSQTRDANDATNAADEEHDQHDQASSEVDDPDETHNFDTSVDKDISKDSGEVDVERLTKSDVDIFDNALNSGIEITGEMTNAEEDGGMLSAIKLPVDQGITSSSDVLTGLEGVLSDETENKDGNLLVVVAKPVEDIASAATSAADQSLGDAVQFNDNKAGIVSGMLSGAIKPAKDLAGTIGPIADNAADSAIGSGDKDGQTFAGLLNAVVKPVDEQMQLVGAGTDQTVGILTTSEHKDDQEYEVAELPDSLAKLTLNAAAAGSSSADTDKVKADSQTEDDEADRTLELDEVALNKQREAPPTPPKESASDASALGKGKTAIDQVEAQNESHPGNDKEARAADDGTDEILKDIGQSANEEARTEARNDLQPTDHDSAAADDADRNADNEDELLEGVKVDKDIKRSFDDGSDDIADDATVADFGSKASGAREEGKASDEAATAETQEQDIKTEGADEARNVSSDDVENDHDLGAASEKDDADAKEDAKDLSEDIEAKDEVEDDGAPRAAEPDAQREHETASQASDAENAGQDDINAADDAIADDKDAKPEHAAQKPDDEVRSSNEPADDDKSATSEGELAEKHESGRDEEKAGEQDAADAGPDHAQGEGEEAEGEDAPAEETERERELRETLQGIRAEQHRLRDEADDAEAARKAAEEPPETDRERAIREELEAMKAEKEQKQIDEEEARKAEEAARVPEETDRERQLRETLERIQGEQDRVRAEEEARCAAEEAAKVPEETDKERHLREKLEEFEAQRQRDADTKTEAETKEAKEKEKVKDLAIRLCNIVENAISKVEPALAIVNENLDQAERKKQQGENVDEEALVSACRPALEGATGALREADSNIKSLDPDGSVRSMAKNQPITPEQHRLAEILSKLTGDLSKGVENARNRLKNFPKAEKKLSPLLGLLEQPLFQIIAGVGLLLNGVLSLLGNLLGGLGLGKLFTNMLPKLGLGKVLGKVGLGKFVSGGK